MARIAAAVRLLAALTRRDLRSVGSVGQNNLFFCVIFIMLGGTARQAFSSTLMFQFALLTPMLFVIAADSLARIPQVRELLWPLPAGSRLAIRAAGVAMSPAFWLLGLLMLAWGGPPAGIGYVAIAFTIQVLVFAAGLVKPWKVARPMRFVPRFPGQLGGIVQLSVRQIFTTLDFYAALLLSLAGAAYRWSGRAPEAEAFPILATLVAVALSTVAQQMFGLETTGSLARYELFPLPRWKILLAKDLAWLAIAAVLVAPLRLRDGLACSLMMVAIGRFPSIRERVPQKPWRFTGGVARFGVLQVILGGLSGLASERSGWTFAVPVTCWALSLYLGQRWWERRFRDWHAKRRRRWFTSA